MRAGRIQDGRSPESRVVSSSRFADYTQLRAGRGKQVHHHLPSSELKIVDYRGQGCLLHPVLSQS